MRKNTIFNQDCLKTMKRMEDSSGDIIYDPFMGSGTTAVVAKKLLKGSLLEVRLVKSMLNLPKKD